MHSDTIVGGGGGGGIIVFFPSNHSPFSIVFFLLLSYYFHMHKVLILAHKSFYETAPQYLSALVTRKDYVKNTRSSTDHYSLCTPPLSKDCSNTFLERSSFFSAPREWNRLGSIKKSDFNMFKKSVKTELFVQC